MYWTTTEIQVLLEVTLQYKEEKSRQNIDWRSHTSTYHDIWKAFLQVYPVKRAEEGVLHFPHDVERINKAKVIFKLVWSKLQWRNRREEEEEDDKEEEDDEEDGDSEDTCSAWESESKDWSSTESEDKMEMFKPPCNRRLFEDDAYAQTSTTEAPITAEKMTAMYWTNSERKVLLEVMLQYKEEKSGQNIDWRSHTSTYHDIWKAFLQVYPVKRAEAGVRHFPHDVEKINKAMIIFKLTEMQRRFHKYDCCYRFWYIAGRIWSEDEVEDELWGESESSDWSSTESEDCKDTKALSSLQTSTTEAPITAEKMNLMYWTNSERKVLLEVTLQYKEEKSRQNIEWRSHTSTYHDIWKAFLQVYPVKRAEEGVLHFPHDVEKINKAMIIFKLTDMRRRFHKSNFFYRLWFISEKIWSEKKLCEESEDSDVVVEKDKDDEVEENIKDTKAALESESSDWSYTESEDCKDTKALSSLQTSTTEAPFTAEKMTAKYWTNSEIEALLMVTAQYKNEKSRQNIDWRSHTSTYHDIWKAFLQVYPVERAEKGVMHFPHDVEKINKAMIIFKLTDMRRRFQKSDEILKKSDRFGYISDFIWGADWGEDEDWDEEEDELWGEYGEDSEVVVEEEEDEVEEDSKDTKAALESESSDWIFTESEDQAETLKPPSTRRPFEDDLYYAQYKVEKSSQNIDWRSHTSTYHDIWKAFLQVYPVKRAEEGVMHFPHDVDMINKAKVIFRLMDMGGSSHRQLDNFYSRLWVICEKIWDEKEPSEENGEDQDVVVVEDELHRVRQRDRDAHTTVQEETLRTVQSREPQSNKPRREETLPVMALPPGSTQCPPVAASPHSRKRRSERGSMALQRRARKRALCRPLVVKVGYCL
uniref:Uncharacterized protein n=1 Tax=Knipowitschia caucasica TaxID=637954 RepID=A0AAV2IYL5_KNICA